MFGDILGCVILALMIAAPVCMALRNRKEAREEWTVEDIELILEELQR